MFTEWNEPVFLIRTSENTLLVLFNKNHLMYFTQDPVKEITKLAKFLDVKENLPLFEEIAEKCSFNNLKQASESKRYLTDTSSTSFVYRKGMS